MSVGAQKALQRCFSFGKKLRVEKKLSLFSRLTNSLVFRGMRLPHSRCEKGNIIQMMAMKLFRKDMVIEQFKIDGSLIIREFV